MQADDNVILTQGIPSKRLPASASGRIVYVHEDGNACEVLFPVKDAEPVTATVMIANLAPAPS